MLCKFQDLGDTGYEDSDDAVDQLEWRLLLDKNPTVTGIMDELRIQGDMRTLKRVSTFAARNFSEVSRLNSFL